MTYPCIACPREWNLPDNYESLSDDEKSFYFHAWSIDGNMKAEHVTSRRPENNVQIFPGAGYLPKPEDFAAAMKTARGDKDLPKTTVRS